MFGNSFANSISIYGPADRDLRKGAVPSILQRALSTMHDGRR